jgi:hypothetical protein
VSTTGSRGVEEQLHSFVTSALEEDKKKKKRKKKTKGICSERLYIIIREGDRKFCCLLCGFPDTSPTPTPCSSGRGRFEAR